ncbi:MAG TPA: RES domain-containing protein [Flammeovirgaceae bacterium]|nr:RES domain-containing protein [Flammeovirgaceae bacterium]
MVVFRLSKRKYADRLSGRGAAKYANRWNSMGTEIIYTSESRALAMAEVAVHLTLATLPDDYVMIEINIPDKLSIEQVHFKDLPANWASSPPVTSTQRIGDAFVSSMQACVLKVPSAVVPGDYNFLLNPHHKDFKQIKIIKVVPFVFDKRIFQN